MAGKALVFTEADRDDNGRVSVRAIDPLSGDRPLLFSTAAHDAPAAAPARALPSRRVQVAVAVAALLVLTAAWALLPRSTRPTAARPTMLPTVPATTAPAVAASAPSAAPTAKPGCTITRAAATFYAPAGDATGDALEAGTTCQLVAWHSGFADWRQIAVGSTPIWVRVSVLNESSTEELPDLAPPPTPTPAPASPRPIVIVEQAPPAPTQCATVRGGGAVVQRCGAAPLDQLQADAEAAWRGQMQPTAQGGE